MIATLTTITRPQPIARQQWPTRREDFDAIVDGDQPVIFNGALTGSRALERWTPDFFARELGDVTAPIQLLSSRGFRDLRIQPMTLSTFVERMRDPNERPPPYLGVWPVLRDVPRVANDAPVYEHLRRRRVDEPLLSITAKGHAVPFHLDIAHNLFAQLHGRRKVITVSPRDRRALYHPSLLRSWHWWESPVDPEHPDLKRHPRFARANRFEAILEPGEVLFIPSCHRHYLRSLEEAVSLTTFWAHDFRQRTLRKVLAMIGRGTT